MIEHVSELVWLQRGGVPYDQAWQLSQKERVVMMKQGEARMKVVKETKIALI